MNATPTPAASSLSSTPSASSGNSEPTFPPSSITPPNFDPANAPAPAPTPQTTSSLSNFTSPPPPPLSTSSPPAVSSFSSDLSSQSPSASLDSSPPDYFKNTPLMSRDFDPNSGVQTDSTSSSLFDNLDSDPYFNNKSAPSSEILAPPAATKPPSPLFPDDDTSRFEDSLFKDSAPTPAYDPLASTPVVQESSSSSSSSSPGFFGKLWSILPSFSAADEVPVTSTSIEIMPWKAIFFSLLIFLLISYIFRIDWNFLIDYVFTYITILAKSIYNSVVSAKKETDTKKRGSGKQGEKTDDEQKQTDDQQPEIEFETPSKSSSSSSSSSSSGFTTIKPFPAARVSSPFLPLDKQQEFFSLTSSSKPQPASKIGNQFCLVGELNNQQRACVLVDSPQECMSNKVFSSKLDCLNNQNELSSSKQEDT